MDCVHVFCKRLSRQYVFCFSHKLPNHLSVYATAIEPGFLQLFSRTIQGLSRRFSQELKDIWATANIKVVSSSAKSTVSIWVSIAAV